MQCLKYAKIPIISVASGLALGGGCEILLHSKYVVANQNVNAGLVETQVGLIPGWGGLKELVLRSQENTTQLVRSIKNIITHNKTSSAEHFAEDYMVNLKVNMNTDELLEDATNFKNYEPNPVILDVKIPEFSLQDFEEVDDHTKSIVQILQTLSGRKMTEDDLISFEHEVFTQLMSTPTVLTKIKKIVR